MFSNGTFESGTTGWAAQNATLTAADYQLRIAISGAHASVRPGFYQSSIASVQYAPFVVRGVMHAPTVLVSVGPYIATDTLSSFSYGVAGFRHAVLVLDSATIASSFPAVIADSSGYTVKDYLSCSFASLARCALVDNGPNLLPESDDFSDAAWTKSQSSVSSTTETAPDGTATAQMLAEDGTAAALHRVSDTITVASTTNLQYSTSCYIKADNRTWARLQMFEGTGSAIASFDLSGGVLGVVSAGTNWENVRATIDDAGNGWYFCALTARKTSTSTSLGCYVEIAEADNDVVFNGLNQDSVVLWRATLAQSSVPTRPVATTTTAIASGTAQTGSALHLKGLPASTNGILLAGDYVQIPGIDQLVRARTALNSDAAGLGYFEFEPLLHASPADNAPVIDVTPLARMMMEESSIRVAHRPGGFIDVEFTAVEDIAA